MVGLRRGNGGEPEGLGWAWQPQNQPLSGNRVHQTRMNWRQVNNLLLTQVTNPSFPTTTFRNNPILLGLAYGVSGPTKAWIFPIPRTLPTSTTPTSWRRRPISFTSAGRPMGSGAITPWL